MVQSGEGEVSKVFVTSCKVEDATGVGFGSFISAGSESQFIISGCEFKGGQRIRPPIDTGILILGTGKATKSTLHLLDSQIYGRMSDSGRNMIILADREAEVNARLQKVHSGMVGQDGLVGVVATAPATVKIDIDDSLFEKAWTNIEGTLMNLPPIKTPNAEENLMKINVNGSIIRNPQTHSQEDRQSEVPPQNFNLGPTTWAGEGMPVGRYELSVKDSHIEGGECDFYIGAQIEGPLENQGIYRVFLRNNVIRNSSPSQFILAADHIRVDARQNCWGSEGGLTEKNIRVAGNGNSAQIDASEPIHCPVMD
jgi:hypothetical protein